ncbi:amino acid ABC transporter ATP-binding/permease protein [Afifella sp. YEN Y35]|uniref:amino acid ABC transporter ATP-binding/permease protein n=1 Tax=Afifella sp. YEN Y35 TaxID=3388337 RepID=UPI0039E0CFE5
MRAAWTDLRPVLAVLLAERRPMLAAGAALAAVTVLAGVGLLGLSGWFITATAIAGLSTATALAFDVFAPAAAIRFLAIARTAGRYGERLTTHEATLSALAALRERLFRGWAPAGAARHLLERPARLLFRLTVDIDALDSVYLRILVPFLAAFAAAAATGLVLAALNPWLGLAAFLWLAVLGLAIPLRTAAAALPPGLQRAHLTEALRARTIDLVAGQTELAMAARLTAQRRTIERTDRRLVATDERLNRIETSASVAFGVAGALLLAGTLYVAARLAQANEIGAPAAALAILVVFAAVEPFAALKRGAVELGRTRLAARRLAPRLETDPAAPTRATSMPQKGEAARLKSVDFRYPGAKRLCLSDISLTLAEGETLAIVGPSGAGKSTLLALLADEATPEAGDIAHLPATLLTQRTELFQDTLAGNLQIADPHANEARLWRALEAAGLRADVEALPAGLETRLGEGGLGLSGGQARRLSLARLFLRDTPLWLLDEPTEGLDGPTAREIMRRLQSQRRGRSLVISTHLRREAEIADRLVILEQGQIVAAPRRNEPGFEQALEALRPD